MRVKVLDIEAYPWDDEEGNPSWDINNWYDKGEMEFDPDISDRVILELLHCDDYITEEAIEECYIDRSWESCYRVYEKSNDRPLFDLRLS